MEDKGKVRFIRVNGRVVPVRGKGGKGGKSPAQKKPAKEKRGWHRKSNHEVSNAMGKVALGGIALGALGVSFAMLGGSAAKAGARLFTKTKGMSVAKAAKFKRSRHIAKRSKEISNKTGIDRKVLEKFIGGYNT